MKNNEQKRKKRFDQILLILFQASILLIAIFLHACNKDEIIKGPEDGKPGKPDTVNLPDTLIHLPDTVIHFPDTTVKDPDTSTAKVLKVNWSELDYKEYYYDSVDRLSRYYFQYVYVQNDPSKIKYFDYRFKYDDQGKLVETTYNDKTKTVYEYEGNVLKKAKEYTLQNQQIAEFQFTFNQHGQLTELISDKDYTSHSTVLKYNFEYNFEGNLVEMKQFYLENGSYQLSLIYNWDSFDHNRHVENATSFFPFIHDIQYWKNNPGRRVVKDKNGNQVGAVEKYRYSSNLEGYPVSKTTEVIYDKSFSSTCYFTYKNW